MAGYRSFTLDFLEILLERARGAERKRHHLNPHASYEEPCQRLFNAMTRDSYIRPHRHNDSQGAETIVAIRGNMAVVVFDDDGDVIAVEPFDVGASALAAGVEVTAGSWHTVVALTREAVMLELKGGPFDPEAKFPAPWAPKEGGSDAMAYLKELRRECLSAP